MPRNMWLLIIGMAINITGSSLVWPLNTIFIHNHLGASLTVSGLLLMFYSAAGIIGNLAGGTLYDRIGGFYTVLVGGAISFLATLSVTFFHSLITYGILLLIVGFGSGLIFPPMYAMAGSNWPEGGRRTYNSLYVSQNLGVAIGASAGGFLASFSFTLTFFSNALLYGVFLVIVALFYRKMDDNFKSSVQLTNVLEQKKKIKRKAPFLALLWICLAFLLCWVAYVQWQSTIASYTQQLGIPLKSYSLLWTMNGLLIVVGQPVIKWLTTRLPSLKTQISIGIGFFILSYISLLLSHQFVGFVIAMGVLTIGEMLVWPAVPTLANELAPKNRTGFYQGFVNSTATGGRMVGPLIGGVIVDLTSIHVMFVSLIFVFLAAGIIAHFYDVPLIIEKRKQAHTEKKAYNLRKT